MSTNPAEWRDMLKEAEAHQAFSITFKIGGGREDGRFRAAVGRFNGYTKREIRIALVQDEITLSNVCRDGKWPTPDGSHRVGIEFEVTGLVDVDKFIREIKPAVESIKRVMVTSDFMQA